MEKPRVVLLGELAAHARGRNLAVSFGAKPAMEPPEYGVVIVFGRDFQNNADHAGVWVDWASRPRHLLIIVPPYALGVCSFPISWEARRVGPLAGGVTRLCQILAAERQYEIRGSLLSLEKVGGLVITAGWRKHPAAGLVVFTALPLWSLAALDHSVACADWVGELYSQGGRGTSDGEATHVPNTTPLSEAEWAMLLHLSSGPFANTAEALAALSRSPVMKMEKARAQQALVSLEARGLSSPGALTPEGETTLFSSRYAAFAFEMRRQRNG